LTRLIPLGQTAPTQLHSHSVEEILDRISEYFEAIGTGKTYFGENGPPQEIIEAPVLDSCEAAA